MTNKYYVYILYDPRKHDSIHATSDGTPFYVGKGCGRRAYKHLHESEEKTNNLHKWHTIQAIRRTGVEPIVVFQEAGLGEDIAYSKETELIKYYGRAGIDEGGILTNIVLDSQMPITHYWNEEARKEASVRTTEYFKDNDEARKRNSEQAIAYFSNDATRENLSNIKKEYYTNQEARDRASIKQKEYLEKNPEALAAMSDYAKAFWHDEKYTEKREKKLGELREYWADEGNRDAQRQRRLKFLEENPGFAKEVSLRGEDHPLYGKKRDQECVEKTAMAHRGQKRTSETREKMAEKKRGKFTERSPEAVERRIAGVRANMWKAKTTRPLNKEFRDKILPLVYGQIIIHELVRDKFKTFKIVDLEKEAFRPEKGREDRLVICLKGNLVFKFIIG